MHGHARRQLQQAEEGRSNGTLREFRDHAVAFATVNGGLIALNLATSPHYLWALWPLFSWGIGFVSHAASTYNALRAARAQGSSFAAPVPPPPASEAERERPWPDLEER
jgi:hypothetical protein